MIPQINLLAFGKGVEPAPSVQAVLSTFTYNSQGALESHLYDGDDTSAAADPRGLQSDSAVAFDFGTAKTFTSVRLKVANTFGFAASVSFRVQYSDTGLASGFVDAGTTVTALSGTGGIDTQAIGAVGAHRYWRIFYLSGAQTGNAWLGELTFS